MFTQNNESEKIIVEPIKEIYSIPTDEELEEEYDIYHFEIRGSEKGLKELHELFCNLENDDGYTQLSQVLKAVGIEPKSGDDDVWWDMVFTEGPKGVFDIDLYEHLKRPFSIELIKKVIRALRNAHDINPEIEWELVSNGFSEPKDDDLVLTCSVCGRKSDELLNNPTGEKNAYSWAKSFAYDGCLWFCQEGIVPKTGDVLKVVVSFPVCCKKGGVFSCTFGESGDIFTMRFLNIVKHKASSAKVLVKLLSIRNRLSYVEPVTEEEKLRLKKEKTYDYVAPNGDWLMADYGYVNDNVVSFRNSFGGGDVCFEDYILTDDDGIDHLIQSRYSDFDRCEAYYGDKVLGFHEHSPYFPPPQRLSNGSIVQGVPKVFIDSLKRHAERDGIVPWLQNMVNDIKSGRYSGDFRDGLYTKVTVSWIGKISVEGFLCAVRMVIEKVTDSDEEKVNDEIKRIYNEIVTNMISRSYVPISFETFQL